jgi:hypothetical protein
MVHKTKANQLSKRQLENLEEKINQEINSEVKFGITIEELEQYSNGKFSFSIWNESGEGMSKEEGKALNDVLRRNLGSRFEMWGSSLFPIFGHPHY